MTLTREQEGAVRSAGSVAVTAGAGTGKTHMLTERYLHHLKEDELRPLQIVAATFTERAAAELRGRIRNRLRAEPELAELAAELEAAQIGTLHSLAGRICREHPDAADVPYDFAVMDELEQRLWLERNLRAALATLPPRLVTRVPFDTMSQTLRSLLADPYTAELALKADPDRWQELIDSERVSVYRRIASHDEWRRAVAVLREQIGPDGDRIELQRAAAIAAIDSFEAGDFSSHACEALGGLNLSGGSKKAWGEGGLDLVKKACTVVRDAYRQVKDVLELRLGPADETLREVLPEIAEAYGLVRDYLETVKRSERVLDFNDLELRAIRALDRPEVREFYRRRWFAFLVDEFQDTNPAQADLLARLTGIGSARIEAARLDGAPIRSDVRLTVVGDEKQSIYGFRRADLTVFREVRGHIEAAGGNLVELSTSFRTHSELLEPLNEVVAPALAELHQSLKGARTEPPGEGPYLSLHLVTDGPGLKQFNQRAEADMLGELISEMMNEGTPVHDKETNELRPLRPGDIAILTRTWNALGPYGEELAARGIPTIHAGGGNLLEQREAKDAGALLRFLADSSDDLALAAVLRSPFFALDDRTLLELAETARRASSWWDALRSIGQHPSGQRESTGATSGGRLEEVAGVLETLRRERNEEAPTRLLARADELTGYSAVIANLPGGPRRLADWRGFVDFVRRLERGHEDVFTVVRELKLLASLPDVKIPRPGMEAGDAVALMTVHNAKGLEWPVVILPDITARGPGGSGTALFDAAAGLAFTLRDEDGEQLVPALYSLLDGRRKQADVDEEMRVLYVALTRARDRAILTGNAASGGLLKALLPGLQAAGIEARLVPFDPAAAVPKSPLPEAISERADRLLGATGPGLSELPVTSLSTYSICPKRFRFEHLLQHPGVADDGEIGRSEHRGSAYEPPQIARGIGTLAHLALERDITDIDSLERFARGLEQGLEREHAAKASVLAESFRISRHFDGLRDLIRERERHVAVPLNGFLLHGVADAVGPEFVLDYKTGYDVSGSGGTFNGSTESDGGAVEAAGARSVARNSEAEAHLLQVAVYAHALERPYGHVAYLHTDRPSLRTFSAAELEQAMGKVATVLTGIASGDFAADPDPGKCSRCSFRSICEDSAAATRTRTPARSE